mmetsp:Transcript_30404/g.30904  ORF Transcript_30404/g.30904 Transcript_30404/m.30904 type:complete len:854 (+) Transcript_30404:134-2695(+)
MMNMIYIFGAIFLLSFLVNTVSGSQQTHGTYHPYLSYSLYSEDDSCHGSPSQVTTYELNKCISAAFEDGIASVMYTKTTQGGWAWLYQSRYSDSYCQIFVSSENYQSTVGPIDSCFNSGNSSITVSLTYSNSDAKAVYSNYLGSVIEHYISSDDCTNAPVYSYVYAKWTVSGCSSFSSYGSTSTTCDTGSGAAVSVYYPWVSDCSSAGWNTVVSTLTCEYVYNAPTGYTYQIAVCTTPSASSYIPTSSPVSSPSLSLSSSPPVASYLSYDYGYFVYAIYTSNQYCNDTPVKVFGNKIGTCFSITRSEYPTTLSFKYSLYYDTSYFYLQEEHYLDNNCQVLNTTISNNYEQFNKGCSGNYGYSMNIKHYQNYNDIYNLISNTNGALIRYYDSMMNCNNNSNNELGSFQWYAVGCYDGEYVECDNDGMNLIEYKDSFTCEGEGEKEYSYVSSSCSMDPQEDFTGIERSTCTGASGMISTDMPTLSPSMKPSKRPTRKPAKSPVSMGKPKPTLNPSRKPNLPLPGHPNPFCDLAAALGLSRFGWRCDKQGNPLTNMCTRGRKNWEGLYCYHNQVHTIYLPSKSLTGTLPQSIGLITSLTYLALDGNSLSGSIPESVGQMTSLKYMYLDENSLTGQVPDSLCRLSGLNGLSVTENPLSCYSGCLSDMTSFDYGSVQPCSASPSKRPRNTRNPTANPRPKNGWPRERKPSNNPSAKPRKHPYYKKKMTVKKPTLNPTDRKKSNSKRDNSKKNAKPTEKKKDVPKKASGTEPKGNKRNKRQTPSKTPTRNPVTKKKSNMKRKPTFKPLSKRNKSAWYDHLVAVHDHYHPHHSSPKHADDSFKHTDKHHHNHLHHHHSKE